MNHVCRASRRSSKSADGDDLFSQPARQTLRLTELDLLPVSVEYLSQQFTHVKVSITLNLCGKSKASITLLASTLLVSVGRTFGSVCLSVCLQHNSKHE